MKLLDFRRTDLRWRFCVSFGVGRGFWREVEVRFGKHLWRSRWILKEGVRVMVVVVEALGWWCHEEFEKGEAVTGFDRP